ncbi:MAG: peptidylprolyl isomerase [Dehalococcoidia bacterium]
MAKAKTQSGRPRASRRTDPEQMSRILLVGGVAAVLLIAAGVIAFGWYQTEIKPGGKTVLQVGKQEYSLNALTRRAKLTVNENTIFQQPQYAQALPETVMLQLEREAKLIERANTLNDITVTEDEIDAKIKETGALAADADPGAFAAEFGKQLAASGLHRDEFRQKIRADLLEQKLRNYYLYLSPAEEPQVRARVILVADRNEGRQVLERLDAGEDFATVAREVSQDTTSAEKGGEMDWTTRGAFPDDKVEDFLFADAQPGDRSEVIDTSVGAYIVELIERADSRALDDTQKQLVADRELEDWFKAQDDELTIERHLSAEDTNRVINDVY